METRTIRIIERFELKIIYISKRENQFSVFLLLPSCIQIVFLIVLIFKKGKEVYWSNIHEQHRYICCHCSENYTLTYELIWPQMKITSNKIEKTKKIQLRNHCTCSLNLVLNCMYKGDSSRIEVWMKDKNQGFPQIVVYHQW